MSPATSAISGRTKSGTSPASSRMPSTLPAIASWSNTISERRRPVRSIHAPSSGPVTRLGSVTAATVAPASVGLSVRSSTSSTTPTENISSATRASVAADRKRG